MRAKLARQMLLAKTVFTPVVSACHDLGYQMQCISVISYQARKEAVNNTVDPGFARFKLQQIDKRMSALNELSGLLDQIECVLQQCCLEVQQRADLPDAASMEVIKQYIKSQLEEEGSDRVVVLDISKQLDQRYLREIASRFSVSITTCKGNNLTIQGSHTACLLVKSEIERVFNLPTTQLKSIRSKIRSMTHERETIKTRISNMKRCMTEVQCLGKLILLVKHIVAESMFKSALIQGKQLLQASDEDGSENTILIHIRLLYEKKEIAFSPDSGSIKQLFSDLLSSVVDTIQKVRFSQNSKLHQYADMRRMPTIRISSDERFQFLQSQLSSLVGSSFVLVQQFIGRFSAINPLYRYLTTDWDDLKKEWANPEEVAPQFFRNTFSNLNHVRKELIRVYNKSIGPLHVNLLTIKDEILPMLEKCEDDLEEVVVKSWKTRVELLLKDISETKRLVSDTSMKLAAFSALAKVIKQVDATIHTFVSREQESEILYEIIEKRNFQLTIRSRGLRDSLVGTPTALEMLQVAFQTAKHHKDDNIKKITIEIEEQAAVLGREIMKIETILCEAALTGRSTQAETALQQLSDLDKLLQTKEKAVLELNTCYENLGFDPLVISPSTRTMLDNLRTAWELLSYWKHHRNRMYKLPLKEVCVQDIEREVNSFNKKAELSQSTLDIDLTTHLIEIADEEIRILPVVLCLVNPAMKSIHWRPIFEAIQQPYTPNTIYTIDKLLQWNIVVHSELVHSQSFLASGQLSIESSISKLESTWDTCYFHITEVNSITRIHNSDEVLSMLEDSKAKIGELLSSRFIFNLQPTLKSCLSTFDTAGRSLVKWIEVQKSWTDLQLASTATPTTVRDLTLIDGSYRDLMSRNCIEGRSVLKILTDPKVTSLLRSASESVITAKEALTRQLQARKRDIPLLQSLSNEDFLSVMSGSPDFSIIFPGIADIIKSDKSYVSVVSTEGEQLQFPNPVPIDSTDPGKLIVNLQQEIHQGMKASISKAIRSRGPRRNDWVLNHPGQATQIADLAAWTSLCEHGILQKDLKSSRCHHIDALSTTIRSAQRGQLTAAKRMAVCSLIVLNMNWRDILSTLLEEGDDLKTTSFSWTRQLRLYPTHTQSTGVADHYISHASLKINYGYEYKGCKPRCVQTPESDKNAMLFALGLQSQNCIAIEGSSLSGKTEYVKDYSVALGKHVMILQCSAATTQLAISGVLYSGMSAGSWVVFDNINLLSPEVLSVASHLLSSASAAARSGAEVFTQVTQVQTEVPIREFGVFTTICKSLKENIEIPQTLKDCVRPISISTPDPVAVATTIIQGYGVEDALFLGAKLGTFWKMALGSLSPAVHHNFTLRTLVYLATELSLRKRNNTNTNSSLLMEQLIKRLCLGSIGIDDSNTLNTIIRCSFDVTEGVSAVLEPKKVESCSYSPHSAFLNQVDAGMFSIEERRALLLSGPACTGKSSCLSCISILTNYSLKVLCPAMYTAAEFYGFHSPGQTSHQDGILSLLLKKPATPPIATNSKQKPQPVPPVKRKIIVFDCNVGDWINGLLGLFEGESTLRTTTGGIFSVSSSVSIAVECRSIEEASPSLLGRVNLINFDSGDLSFSHILHRANRLGNPILWDADIIDTLTVWMQQQQVTAISTQSFLTVLGAFIKSEAESIPTVDSTIAFKMLIMHAVVWGIAAGEHKEIWYSSLQNLFKILLPGMEPPEDFFSVEPCIVTEMWTPWNFTYNESDKTNNSLRYIIQDTTYLSRLKLSSLFVDNGVSIVLVGCKGCGKGHVLKHLAHNPSAQFTQLTPCNSDPTDIQKMLTGGRNLFLCIADVHITSERSKSTTAVDCFRHIISEKALYSITNYVREVKLNVTIASTANPSKHINKNPLGNNSVSIHWPDVDDKCVKYLIQNHLQSVFEHSIVSDRLLPAVQSLVKVSCDVWQAARACLKWKPQTPQYSFSINDLMHCASSLSMWMPKVTRIEEVVGLYKYELERSLSDRCHDNDSRDWAIATLDEIISKYVEKSPSETYYGKDGLCDLPTLKTKIESIKEKPTIFLSNESIKVILAQGRLLRIPGTSILLQGILNSGKTTLLSASATYEQATIIDLAIDSELEIIKTIRNAIESASFCKTCTILRVDMDSVSLSQLSDVIVNYVSAALSLSRGYLPYSLVPPDFLMEIARMHASQRSDCGIFEALKIGCNKHLRVVLTTSPDSISFVSRYFPSLVGSMQHHVVLPKGEDELLYIATHSLSPPSNEIASLSIRIYELAKINVISVNTKPKDDSSSSVVFEADNGNSDDDLKSPLSPGSPGFFSGLHEDIEINKTIGISQLLTFIQTWNSNGAVQHDKHEKIESAIQLIEEVFRIRDRGQSELQVALPQLEDLIEQNDNLTRCLERDNQAYVESKIQVSAKEEKFNKYTIEENTLTELIHSTLNKIVPMLTTALEAVRGITKKEIDELMIIKSPSPKIIFVMDYLLNVLELKPGWDNAKRILADYLHDRLTSFSTGVVYDSVISCLGPVMNNPDFQPAVIRILSPPVACVCQWMRAAYFVAEVYRKLESKRNRLTDIQNAKIELKSLILASKEDLEKLELVRAKSETDQKRGVKAYLAAQDARIKMECSSERAGIFAEAVQSIYDGWLEIMRTRGNTWDSRNQLLLDSAMKTYAGSRTPNKRISFIKTIQRELAMEATGLWLPTGSDELRKRWILQGLPNDDYNFQSAYFVRECCQEPNDGNIIHLIPMMVDPHGVSSLWLRSLYNSIIFTRACNIDVIIDASRRGVPIVLEHFTQADLTPILLSYLTREISSTQGFQIFLLGSCPVSHPSITNILFDVNEGITSTITTGLLWLNKPNMYSQMMKQVNQVSVIEQKIKLFDQELIHLLGGSSGLTPDSSSLSADVRSNRSPAEAAISEMKATQKLVSQMEQEAFQTSADNDIALLFVILSRLCGTALDPDIDQFIYKGSFITLNLFLQIIVGWNDLYKAIYSGVPSDVAVWICREHDIAKWSAAMNLSEYEISVLRLQEVRIDEDKPTRDKSIDDFTSVFELAYEISEHKKTLSDMIAYYKSNRSCLDRVDILYFADSPFPTIPIVISQQSRCYLFKVAEQVGRDGSLISAASNEEIRDVLSKFKCALYVGHWFVLVDIKQYGIIEVLLDEMISAGDSCSSGFRFWICCESSDLCSKISGSCIKCCTTEIDPCLSISLRENLSVQTAWNYINLDEWHLVVYQLCFLQSLLRHSNIVCEWGTCHLQNALLSVFALYVSGSENSRKKPSVTRDIIIDTVLASYSSTITMSDQWVYSRLRETVNFAMSYNPPSLCDCESAEEACTVMPDTDAFRSIEESLTLLPGKYNKRLALNSNSKPVRKLTVPDKIKLSDSHPDCFAPVDLISRISNPHSACLVREVNLINATIQRVSDDLIKSTTDMKHHIDTNTVPHDWIQYGYPSVSPLGEYLTNLRRRVSWLNEWSYQGPPPVFFLSSLSFPSSFITATLLLRCIEMSTCPSSMFLSISCDVICD